jgi:uncharacterized protein (DUF983 family)
MNKNIQSVLSNKCPNCLKGDYFITKNPFNLKDFEKMHPQCTHCGMDFKQEPGFYFGGAIVSYALQALVLLLFYVLFQVMIETPLPYFLTAFAILLVVLLPITFRLSRIIWINAMGTKPEEKK